MQGTIAYGKQSIGFSWFYADRKTLEIAVHPDTSVVIKAPAGTDIEKIKRKVLKRAGWILRQQNFFRQFEPRTTDRHYVGGETHLYLGKHYRLKIKTGDVDAVKLKKGFFEIEVKGEINPETVKQLLMRWYTDKATAKLRISFDLCWAYFEKTHSDKPRLQIRRLQKRWGSLSPKGTLTLNVDLIRAPKECIDYVVVHELCHLQYKYHDPAFYRCLEKMLPDWEKRKHKLEVTLA